MTSRVAFCLVPGVMPEAEASIYDVIRKRHCPRDHGRRQCVGRMTVDRHGLTLTCAVCGDVRSLWPTDDKA